MQPRSQIAWTWLVVVALAGCRSGFEPLPPDAPSDDCTVPYERRPIEQTGRTGCYRAVTTPKTWLDAERDCEDDGPNTHLVVMDDFEEHNVVHSLILDTWVGASELVAEGTYLWVTKTGGFTILSSFFGNTNTDSADCAKLGPDSSGDWSHESCTTALFGFVCERDGKAADPDRYPPP